MTQLHHQHSRTSPEINQKQNGQMTCESRCSWELHCRFQSSKFTIPNDGYIARAAGILTGRTSFLFSIRIFSAAGVVGPLAPSAMIWQEVQTKEFNKNLNQKKGISASFFSPYLSFDSVSIFTSNLFFIGCRHQNVTLSFKQVLFCSLQDKHNRWVAWSRIHLV